MANKETKKVATKATANTKEAKTMKKETTKTETKKVEEKKVTEKKNINKINVTIQDVEKLFTEAGITFKSNNCNYRIIASGSSLNVHKAALVFYTTDEDFKKISDNVKAADLELKEKGNVQDGKRPNYVRFTTEDTLKKVITALTKTVKSAVA